ncbi:MAG: putative lipid II flippase FtsW [Nitrospiraceae bacterium]|uniref:putative lipid II flippase FtsW n=1 Tax=Nitrospira cf. moscoviensis SBR1015 TaxID=96242 RepID=UPI000A0A033D|nr:putative lipid II flippase FtsW [Nitrospira cf. moscoviensis SBR1015]MBY0246471.1 putative lipid II flippase FtsW [Nitrospiraceae bacterium]OQW34961.1 MAG: stage V sporulation protein E [Nitrospira sp. SG-bin2]
MSQRSAGTLTLPWTTASPRATKRVAMDHSLLIITIVLALVGLVMVFSASAVVAGNRFHDPGYFLKRQLAWLAFGFLLLHLASHIDYVWWKRLSIPLLGLTVVLLVMVLIPSLGVSAKGARRWLRLGPISVQPAEIAKLVAVMYLAAYLAKKEDRLTGFLSGLAPALLVIGVLGGLVLLEPDLGTVVVMGSVAIGLLFLGGARLSHLLSLGLCAVPAVLVLVLSSSYRRQRLMTFLAPWKDASDAGFQITQSFLAFGSGGLFGVGLGEGKQKLFFLPEAHTDFVLALVGEELGLVGTGVIILLFALFAIRGFQVAARARMPFGRYLGMGITLLIGVQALINACVVTGLLPTKGLTLPFVSYGGSSLVTCMFGVGILLNISRDRQTGREDAGRRGEGSSRR